ncbi:MAG: hypothetical protein ACI3ZD_17025 [Prevotella sp.]
MENKLEVLKEDAVSAYNSASEEQKEILEQLFGKAAFRPADVRDRVKTFEDACEELGEDDDFVVQYNLFMENVNMGKCEDIISYLKLRIIVAALNEGWEPEFNDSEYRWYPWFYFYTNKEIEDMDEEQKSELCRCVGRSHYHAFANGGLSYAHAYNAFSYSPSSYGARLAFKTKELAKYAGKQFIEIYRDFVIF